MKIILIDNYDSFTFNLYHYISVFSKNVEVIRNDKINSKEILKKNIKKLLFHLDLEIPTKLAIVLTLSKSCIKKFPYLEFVWGIKLLVKHLEQK